MSSYLNINGLFEIVKGQNYSLYNNINEDYITWKKYNNSVNSSSHYNSHGMI